MDELDFYYETIDGITYRVFKNSDHREIIGYNYVGYPPKLGKIELTTEQQIKAMHNEKLLREIIDLAETHPALQGELDKLFTFYFLLNQEKPLIHYQV